MIFMNKPLLTESMEVLGLFSVIGRLLVALED